MPCPYAPSTTSKRLRPSRKKSWRRNTNCFVSANRSRSGNCSTIMPVVNAVKCTGIPSAGRLWSRITAPGTARYAINAGIGGSGTASAVTSVRTAPHFHANTAVPKRLTRTSFDWSIECGRLKAIAGLNPRAERAKVPAAAWPDTGPDCAIIDRTESCRKDEVGSI